jgi:hypothetical protein
MDGRTVEAWHEERHAGAAHPVRPASTRLSGRCLSGAREIEDTYKRYIPTEDAYASAIDDLTPAAFQSFGH